MSLVITGAGSFIGTQLRAQCRAAGHDYVGIDLIPSDDSRGVVADIRSPEVAAAIPRGATALVHLAAISRDEDCRRDPHLAFDVNVQGTLNLIRAARERDVRQFIFASTEWVYGDLSSAGTEQTEDQPIDATTIRSEYALSKLTAEQLLRLASGRGFCPTTVLRFAIVYGPRPANWSAVESLFDTVRRRAPVRVGSLATARRFIHVADIAAGILSAVGRTTSDTFNLSGDRPITLREIVETAGLILNVTPTVVEADPTSASIRSPANTHARQALGWRPTIDLRRGLETLLA